MRTFGDEIREYEQVAYMGGPRISVQTWLSKQGGGAKPNVRRNHSDLQQPRRRHSLARPLLHPHDQHCRGSHPLVRPMS